MDLSVREKNVLRGALRLYLETIGFLLSDMGDGPYNDDERAARRDMHEDIRAMHRLARKHGLGEL